MADDPDPRQFMMMSTAAIFAFIFLALTFGMSEWKTIAPATASAPIPATTVPQ